MPFSTVNAFRLLSCGLALVALSASVQPRALRPDDLFRYERIAGVVWSPDFSRAAVEIHRPRPFVGSPLSSAAIAVVDRDTAAIRVIATPPADAFGFFNAAWSPDGQRLAFFSVGRDGSVTAWIWNGRDAAAAIAGLPVADALADPPQALWPDATHVVFMARDPARANSGSLYSAATRGRNAADEWQTAMAANDAAVAVFNSMAAPDISRARFVRLVSVDVETRAVTTLAEGALHTPRLSADASGAGNSLQAEPVASQARPG